MPLATGVLALMATPAVARDSLGIFGTWGAFRDAAGPRCYAIAEASPSPNARERQPYASIGTWPRRQVHGQVHLRLSRVLAAQPRLTLALGGRRFALVGGGADAWAASAADNAAILAAMRQAGSMSVSATDRSGRRFTDRYALAGAATAMDAATVGCARQR